MTTPSTEIPSNVVGLVPAAGHARRLGPLPCSKEIYPITMAAGGSGRGRGVKVASEDLLRGMQEAGVENVFVLLREGKWDVPSYWGDGQQLGLNIAYLVMGTSAGTPFTLDEAYPFIQDRIVAMGFPDVLYEPSSVYVELLERQRLRGADLVLGLFPADNPAKVDMVEVGPDGRPVRLDIKPEETDLAYSWICAVWTPVFTEYMHRWLHGAAANRDDDGELYVGHVIEAALDDGVEVDAVSFPGGQCVDIGTPEELNNAVRREWDSTVPLQ